MSNKKRDDVRSRDDRHLRELISEARAWMKKEGVEEQALDWEAVAREERALWWRERLQQALPHLAARGREFAETIGSRLRQLAELQESEAEAALEVTLDVCRQMGGVLLQPAQACLRQGTGLDFAHAQAGVRSRLGLSEDDEQSVGHFITSAIPGARVIADVSRQTVSVEFLVPIPTPLVVLVPEDPNLIPRVAEASKGDDTVRVDFVDLEPGRYLLCVYVLEEDSKHG